MDDGDTTAATLDGDAELRAYYGPTSALAARKEIDHVDKHCRAFIEHSPFVVVSTAQDGGWPEASPRGDHAGFVTVEHERLLLLPDRPGNNRLDTLQNVIEDGRVGLLFFVPRITHTLRVYGRARVRTDMALRERFTSHGKPARSVMEVAVEMAYFHCGKAIIRSAFWDPASWPETHRLAPFARVLSDQIAGVDEAEADAKLQESYVNRLY